MTKLLRSKKFLIPVSVLSVTLVCVIGLFAGSYYSLKSFNEEIVALINSQQVKSLVTARFCEKDDQQKSFTAKIVTGAIGKAKSKTVHYVKHFTKNEHEEVLLEVCKASDSNKSKSNSSSNGSSNSSSNDKKSTNLKPGEVEITRKVNDALNFYSSGGAHFESVWFNKKTKSNSLLDVFENAPFLARFGASFWSDFQCLKIQSVLTHLFKFKNNKTDCMDVIVLTGSGLTHYTLRYEETKKSSDSDNSKSDSNNTSDKDNMIIMKVLKNKTFTVSNPHNVLMYFLNKQAYTPTQTEIDEINS